MSCRVFERGVEILLLQNLINLLVKREVKTLMGYYLPTTKNQIVENFFDKVGFDLERKEDRKTVWRLDLSKQDKIKPILSAQHFISLVLITDD